MVVRTVSPRGRIVLRDSHTHACIHKRAHTQHTCTRAHTHMHTDKWSSIRNNTKRNFASKHEPLHTKLPRETIGDINNRAILNRLTHCLSYSFSDLISLQIHISRFICINYIVSLPTHSSDVSSPSTVVVVLTKAI